MADDDGKAVWNFDKERLNALNNYLNLTEQAILSWELESAFVGLQGISMVIYGPFTDPENEYIEKEMSTIEGLRRKLDDEKEGEFYNLRVEMYHKMQKLYKYVNRKCVKHGLYFRKSDNPGEAIKM